MAILVKVDFNQIRSSFWELFKAVDERSGFVDSTIDVLEELDFFMVVEIGPTRSDRLQVRFVDDFGAGKVLGSGDAHIRIVFHIDDQNSKFEKE